MNRIITSIFISLLTIFAAAALPKKPNATTSSPSTENDTDAITPDYILPDSLLAAEWVVFTVNGKKVTGEERPYLHFDMANSRLYGNNGCNTLNADITGGSDGKISFSGLRATHRRCSDAPFEFLINVALDKVRSYQITQHGHEYYLDLTGDRGTPLMTLRRHNMEFLDGAWRIVRINGETNRNENIEIVIDIDAGRLHGNSGCNTINGRIFIDPDKTNSIQFLRISSTRATCPDVALEMSFLIALEEVETAIQISPSEVRMLDNRGEEVLTLRRIRPSLQPEK